MRLKFLAGALTLTALVGCGGGGSSSGSVSTDPAIVTQPATQAVAVGADVAFSVSATGSGLSYQWYEIPSGSTTGTAISMASSSTYRISAVTTGSSGGYYVQVTNGVGSVQSNTATLTVSASTGGGTVVVSSKPR
jgi:hypothetical protein